MNTKKELHKYYFSQLLTSTVITSSASRGPFAMPLLAPVSMRHITPLPSQLSAVLFASVNTGEDGEDEAL
jgi:hypothetical protein